MPYNFFLSQVDYVLFVTGVAFLVLFTSAILQHRTGSKSLAWNWFILFALNNVIYAWAQMLVQLFADQSLPQLIEQGFLLLSLSALSAFIWHSTFLTSHEKPKAFTLAALGSLVLIAPVGLVYFSDALVYLDALNLMLTLITSFWLLWLTRRFYKNSSVEEKNSKILFLSALALFSVLSWLSIFQLSLLDRGADAPLPDLLPLQLFAWGKMLLAVVLAYALWKHLAIYKDYQGDEKKQPYVQVTQYALVFVLLAGWWFTNLMTDFKVSEVTKLAQGTLENQETRIANKVEHLGELAKVAAKAKQLTDTLQRPVKKNIAMSERFLNDLHQELGIDHLYLIDSAGKTLAQSSFEGGESSEVDLARFRLATSNQTATYRQVSLNHEKATVSYLLVLQLVSKNQILGFVVFKQNLSIDCLYKGCLLLAENGELLAKTQDEHYRLSVTEILKTPRDNTDIVLVEATPTLLLQHRIDKLGLKIISLTPIVKPSTRLFSILFILVVVSLILIIFVMFDLKLKAADLLREDKSKLEWDNKELKIKANTDPLTGAFNRLMLARVLEDSLGKAKRFHIPLSVIMLDIDFFKKINDTYGHQVGDVVLKTLSELVKNNIRKTDMLVRLGGEEFLILCQGSTLQNAFILAEKLRLCIKALDIEEAGKITCSFGVGQYQADEHPDKMIARVDAALYQAKEGGRNQVVADDPTGILKQHSDEA